MTATCVTTRTHEPQPDSTLRTESRTVPPVASDGAASLAGGRLLLAPDGDALDPEEFLEVLTSTLPGYRLGAKLAVGRYGPVHRAMREADGHAVTVHFVESTLDRTQQRRFRAETAALKRLPSSAHLLPLVDAGSTASSQPYLVTPAMDGTLASRLAAGPMDALDVARAGLDAATGLSELHRAGKLHGNLAPGNLVELHGGTIALTGFALPVLDELDGSAREPYDPPEVLEGGDWTVTADLYALAGTLFTLLTGSPPYERRDAADLLARMRAGAVPEVGADRAPERLRATLRRGLDPNPQARFGSAADLAGQFDRVLKEATSHDPLARVETVPPQHEQAPGQQFGGRYLVQDQIGEGSMGIVCRAVNSDDGQPVAVKLLKPPFTLDDDAVTRFLREGSALKRVAHPNLVRVRDFIAEGGNFGLVMDLIEGQDLRAVMASQPLTPTQACMILGQVAGALGAVHTSGIIHRDIKPENILIERNGTSCNARLADFGIARFADGATLTQPGMILCTLAYAAPEIRNGAQASKQSDMFALGVVAYELFAGHRPGADNPLARPSALSRPAAMPVELWHLWRECLDDEPSRRPDAKALAPSLMAVARTLSGLPTLSRWGRQRGSSVRTPFLASGMSQTPPAAVAERTPDAVDERVPTAASERPPPAPPASEVDRPSRRWVTVAAATAVIVLGVAAGAISALRGGSQAPDDAAAQTPVTVAASSPASGQVKLTFSGGGPEVAGYLIYSLGPDGENQDGELLNRRPLTTGWHVVAAEAGQRHCFRVAALLSAASPSRTDPNLSAETCVTAKA